MADESPEAHSGGETAAGKLRASHHDRARTVRQLQEAGVAGRLEPDEVDERVAAALSARTLGDLTVLVSDLPGQPPLSAASAGLAHRDRIESELYSAKRDGRWMVPSHLEVRVDSGSVTLDFTEAEITSPTLDIDASVRAGSLTLITRPGIDVHTHDLMVDGGSVKVDAPWAEHGTGPPVLTITVTGKIDVGEMTARPPRRNLKEWLLGDPRPYAPGT
jgi:hypothetical protein